MAAVDEVTRFICLFHDARRASAAVRALGEKGFNVNDIRAVGGVDGSGAPALGNLGVPDRDIAHLQEGLRKGGTLVSLTAPESRSAQVEEVFHKYSAEKIDEAEFHTEEAAGVAAVAPFAAESREYAASDGVVIPVAEEELLVGKREVDRGGVRVYRRTVAEPVSESVDLHSERVALEYREVNRPATEADLLAGSQEIELIETAEVPVVQKVSRVVEEVRVGKVSSDHTEVVQDSVRHTEVEVDALEVSDASLPSSGTSRER